MPTRPHHRLPAAGLVLLAGLLAATEDAPQVAFAVDHYGVHGLYEIAPGPGGGWRLGAPLLTVELYIRKRMQDWPEIETQTIGHTWTRKPAVVTAQTEERVDYAGRAGNRPYTLALRSEDGGIAVDYRIAISPVEAGDPYAAVRERGLVLSVHRPDLLAASASAGGTACARIDGALGTIDILAPLATDGRIACVAPALLTDADKGVRFAQPRRIYIPADCGSAAGDLAIACRIRLPAGLRRQLSNLPFTRRHDQSAWAVPPFDHRTVLFDAAPFVLDPPAGRHGRVTVQDGRFILAGDGRRFRIHGTTLAHGAKFPPHAEAEAMAERIAALGFNLVRLHHLDSPQPEVGLFDAASWRTDASPHLDAEKLERLDYLVHQLRRRGIYLHIDGISLRRFGPQEGIPEADRLTSGLKATAFLLCDERLQQRQRDFLAAIWTHRNPYTGLTYREDPAVATGEINNENDLLTHGINNFPPAYLAAMQRDRTTWLAANPASDPRLDDGLRHGADLMQRYFDRYHAFLRDLGVQAPLCGTNWIKPDERMALHLVHAGMDFTADHPYPPTLAPAILGGRPPASPVPEQPLLLSLAKQEGVPLIHNEWGVRTADRTLLIILQMALTAVLDHDGSMQFAYMHHTARHQPGHGDLLSFNLASDPAQWVVMPALNLMYARGDLPVLPRQRRVALDLPALLGGRGTGLLGDDLRRRLPGIDRAALRERLVFTTAGDAPAWEPPEGMPAEGAVAIGAIAIDWRSGILTVRSPRSKIACGRIAGRAIDLGDGVAVTASTPSPDGYAAVILTSLDEQPIPAAGRVLVTCIGHVEPRDAVFDQDWLNPAYRGDEVLLAPVSVAVDMRGPGADAPYRASACRPVAAGQPMQVRDEAPGPLPVTLSGSSPLWILTRERR